MRLRSGLRVSGLARCVRRLRRCSVVHRLTPRGTDDLRRGDGGPAREEQPESNRRAGAGQAETPDRVREAALSVAQVLRPAALGELCGQRGALRAQAIVRRGQEAPDRPDQESRHE